MEPVFLLHAGQDGKEVGSQPIGVTCEGLIDFGDELSEVLLGISLPVDGEEVIENDVDDDAGKTPSFRSEQSAGIVKGRVGIGEAIKVSVHHDAVDDIVGILLA